MIGLVSLLPLVSSLVGLATADSDSNSLYGTWSSKSNQVFTGPGFYDPIDELLIEPSLPGISYSFTEDGWFESASYQVKANPKNPSCPQAAITFQHGRFEVSDNGTLTLNPIPVDGRQLFSDPCNDNNIASYNRYVQVEIFKSFTVSIDSYHGKYMLQLYQHDGSPMQPLYLAYKPPLMLPTETLNPTTPVTDSASSTGSSQKRSLRKMIKRSLENKHKTNAVKKSDRQYNTAFYWWVSAALIGIGSVAFLVV